MVVRRGSRRSSRDSAIAGVASSSPRTRLVALTKCWTSTPMNTWEMTTPEPCLATMNDQRRCARSRGSGATGHVKNKTEVEAISQTKRPLPLFIDRKRPGPVCFTVGKLKCHHKAGIALACVGLCLSAAPSWSLPVSNPEEFRTYLNKNTNWNNYQFNFTSLGECFVRYKANGKALAYVCNKGFVKRTSPSGEKSSCNVSRVRANRRGKIKLTTSNCQYD